MTETEIRVKIDYLVAGLVTLDGDFTSTSIDRCVFFLLNARVLLGNAIKYRTGYSPYDNHAVKRAFGKVDTVIKETDKSEKAFKFDILKMGSEIDRTRREIESLIIATRRLRDRNHMTDRAEQELMLAKAQLGYELRRYYPDE